MKEGRTEGREEGGTEEDRSRRWCCMVLPETVQPLVPRRSPGTACLPVLARADGAAGGGEHVRGADWEGQGMGTGDSRNALTVPRALREGVCDAGPLRGRRRSLSLPVFVVDVAAAAAWDGAGLFPTPTPITHYSPLTPRSV